MVAGFRPHKRWECSHEYVDMRQAFEVWIYTTRFLQSSSSFLDEGSLDARADMGIG